MDVRSENTLILLSAKNEILALRPCQIIHELTVTLLQDTRLTSLEFVEKSEETDLTSESMSVTTETSLMETAVVAPDNSSQVLCAESRDVKKW